MMNLTATSNPEIIKRVMVVQMESCAPWAVWHDFLNSNSAGSPSSRYALELGVLIEGRSRRYYDGYSMDVEPGEAWLIGMWEPQNWEVLEGPCRELVFFISPEVLLDLHAREMPEAQWLRPFMVSPRLRPQVASGERDAVRDMALQVVGLRHRWLASPVCPQSEPEFVLRKSGEQIQAPIAPPEATCAKLRLVMTQLLLCLLENWNPPAEAMRLEPFSQISPALHRALQTRGLVTVNEAARLCGLNRNLFARRFREMMNMSYSDFSLHHRLNGVAGDLAARHETIENIAARWGFFDGTHLHRCFKRHYGCSPTQYRCRHYDERHLHWEISGSSTDLPPLSHARGARFDRSNVAEIGE